MQSKIEIINITKDLSIHFVYIPDGYKMNRYILENHKIYRIGKLSFFNKSKKLEYLRKHKPDLVNFFTEELKKKGWDFNLYPDPTAVVAYYNKNEGKRTRTKVR